MNPIFSALGSVLSPIVDAYESRQERKAAKEAAEIKIQHSKITNDHNIQLTDAEWEALAVGKSDSTWKDEYITLVVTFPIVGIMFGSLWLALTGDPRPLEGVNIGLENLAKAGIDMGEMMIAVVLAAIGLKFWRGK